MKKEDINMSISTELGVIYNNFVASRVKAGEDIRVAIRAIDCHYLHMLIGLSGEVGELQDAFKKHVIYDKKLDIGNVIEELGDIEFYLEGLRQSIGVTRAEVLTANINKLEKRYAAGKYSNTEAVARADKQED